MSLTVFPAEQRAVIHGVSWQSYQSLLADWSEHRKRLTYDRGALEIMAPSGEHENLKGLIGRLIETFTYAALGVPEVWRHDGDRLVASRLQDDGSYAEVERSSVFAELHLADLERFLDQRDALDETELAWRFRAWVRERFPQA
ncbi:MAG: hypothetical protein HY721_14225 [Planctomycetes bacterium]|nr:hypothetical protein [Planctomycetota bacterium]